VFLGVPATMGMWGLIWRVFPTAPAEHAAWPAWFGPIAVGLDVMQLLIGALGGIALLALGRGLRRIRRPRLVTRSLAVLVWVTLPITLVAGGALMYGSEGPAGIFGYPPGVCAGLASWAFWLVQLCCATRCLAVTRRWPVAA
jgi:hypothetical protein